MKQELPHRRRPGQEQQATGFDIPVQLEYARKFTITKDSVMAAVS